MHVTSTVTRSSQNYRMFSFSKHTQAHQMPFCYMTYPSCPAGTGPFAAGGSGLILLPCCWGGGVSVDCHLDGNQNHLEGRPAGRDCVKRVSLWASLWRIILIVFTEVGSHAHSWWMHSLAGILDAENEGRELHSFTVFCFLTSDTDVLSSSSCGSSQAVT